MRTKDAGSQRRRDLVGPVGPTAVSRTNGAPDAPACTRVLVVEDNPGDLYLLRDSLSQAGAGRFELVHADRLSGALDLIAERSFDIALLDLSLPDSRGLDTYRRVRARAPELPIVILSGFDVESLALDAVRGGAQDYLVKGHVDGHVLERSLQYAIERKRAEVEKEGLIGELREALAKIRALSGLLPICASCKRIRNDRKEGSWSELEGYIKEHSEADFSHSICPDCALRLYPDLRGDGRPSEA